MIAAISTGETSPLMIWRMSESISSWKISRCSITRASASCGVMLVASLQEILQQLVAVLGEDRLGVELHALDRELLWRTPMISPSSVQAVTSRQSGRLARSITSE